MPREAPEPRDGDVDDWCHAHLGAGIGRQLLRAGYLSVVVGVELTDGRRVVVKVRPPSPRLEGCHAVQSALWAAGYPCPEPLVGPTPLDVWIASAEAFVPGGEPMPSTGRAARPFAEALELLTRLAPAPATVPSIDPAPPWNRWDHDDGGLWPTPDDWDGDLDAAGGPAWIDETADAARSWLQRGLGVGLGPSPGGSAVVGHGDWYTANLRWAGDRLLVVHDWDSVLADRLAIVVGFAAATYSAWSAGTEPTVRESEEFVAAFEAARGRPFSDRERADTWAAGLWLRAFDAKKQFAKGQPVRSLTEAEAVERLRLIDMRGSG